MTNQKTICPHCKKQNVVKRGYFQTKVHGKRQRYFCKDCKKKFVPRTPFYRMRNSPQKITLCIDLFFRGISTRKVQEHLQAFYPQNSSWVSIYNWVIKYSEHIAKFTDNLKINTGLDSTPASMATDLELKENNKWLELIRLCTA